MILKYVYFFTPEKKKGTCSCKFYVNTFSGFVWCSSYKKVKGRLNKETHESVRRRFYERIFYFRLEGYA